MTEVPYVRQPIDLPARYAHGPDSFVQPGIPHGSLYKYEWNESRVFPGTRRRFWVYVPANYDGSTLAALMVVQDAEWYLDLDGEVRAPIVLDNLIHKAEMPLTIVVFVEASENRNAEYDAVGDAYANFLLTEILPTVQAEYAITDDPSLWCVAGGSAGANCAFGVAWTRPDRFRRVLCLAAAFAQVEGTPPEGGNPYLDLVRQTEAKPLRIFLHTATRELNWNRPRFNYFGEALRMAAVLAERGYDFRLAVGDGEHNGNHDGVIFPDALRWLWQPTRPLRGQSRKLAQASPTIPWSCQPDRM